MIIDWIYAQNDTHAPVLRLKRKLPPPPPTASQAKIEAADAQRATRSTTEAAAEQHAELIKQMHWRIARYGYPCLTLRELEACQLDMQYKRLGAEETARLAWVASRMSCTRQNVSKLLINATDVLSYFAEEEIAFEWSNLGGMWRLNAPVAPAFVYSPRVRDWTNVLAI